MVIFHSYVSLPEGNLSLCSFDSLDWFKGNIYGVYHAKSPRYRGWNRFDFLTNPYHLELLSKNIPMINSVNPNPKIPKKSQSEKLVFHSHIFQSSSSSSDLLWPAQSRWHHLPTTNRWLGSDRLGDSRLKLVTRMVFYHDSLGISLSYIT